MFSQFEDREPPNIAHFDQVVRLAIEKIHHSKLLRTLHLNSKAGKWQILGACAQRSKVAIGSTHGRRVPQHQGRSGRNGK